MLRRLVWLSLLLVPVTLLADVAGVTDTVLFPLCAASLVPLAYVIGEATEQAGEHTGATTAGLLNASFGNAPELIIALFAVHRGLFEVVRGSLTGSIVSNLLLVLGASFLAGSGGKLDRRSCLRSLALTAAAVALFVVPAAVNWGRGGAHAFLPAITIPLAALLLTAYVVVTAVTIVREHRLRAAQDAGDTIAHWSLRTALAVLAVAAIATALVSELLTRSIEHFAQTVGLGEFFVAAVIVALVGNAAEHGGAIVIARSGKVDLSAEIAFSSSAQVATLVIPAVVLLSLAMTPLPLAFRPVEVAAMLVALVVPGLVLLRRDATTAGGVALCVTYVAVAAAFYAVG